MSKPLRLVPQAAQPIEFCCPLCGSVHAAYIFGTSQFRIFRCGGCALTFSKKATGGVKSSFPDQLCADNCHREGDHADRNRADESRKLLKALYLDWRRNCAAGDEQAGGAVDRPGG